MKLRVPKGGIPLGGDSYSKAKQVVSLSEVILEVK